MFVISTWRQELCVCGAFLGDLNRCCEVLDHILYIYRHGNINIDLHRYIVNVQKRSEMELVMETRFGFFFWHLDDPTSYILKTLKPCSLGEKCL